jgi:type II secretory pathway component PulM
MTKKTALTKPCKQRASMFQPVSFNKLFVQKQELPEKKGTEVSNRKVPNLADLPGLVAANV